MNREYEGFSVADVYTKIESDAKYVPLTGGSVIGDLSVSNELTGKTIIANTQVETPKLILDGEEITEISAYKRNLVINGDFESWQRGKSFTLTPGGITNSNSADFLWSGMSSDCISGSLKIENSEQEQAISDLVDQLRDFKGNK